MFKKGISYPLFFVDKGIIEQGFIFMRYLIIIILLSSLHLYAIDLTGKALFLCYGDPVALKSNLITGSESRNDLALLSSMGYKPIDYKMWRSFRKGDIELPKKNLLLIIPFLNRSTVNEYLPVLKEYGYKAIFFPVTGKNVANQDFTYDLLKRLNQEGHEIGLISNTYPKLLDIGANEGTPKKEEVLRKEIGDNISSLKRNGIGFIQVFLYPYGDVDSSILNIIQDTDIEMSLLPSNNLNLWGTNRFYHKYVVRAPRLNLKSLLTDIEKEEK